jgi:hypothetical protein
MPKPGPGDRVAASAVAAGNTDHGGGDPVASDRDPFHHDDLNLHMIETEEKVSQLAVEKMLNTSLPFLLRLKEQGRARAESWLSQNRAALGRRSTLDLDRFAA